MNVSWYSCMSYHCQMPIPTVNGPDPSVARRSWLEALRVYWNLRVLSMLFLGFSAGLPFYLVFSTLSAWLRQAGVQRSTIGMLSWVGILYSIKFLWAPVVDRVRAAFPPPPPGPPARLDAAGADRSRLGTVQTQPERPERRGARRGPQRAVCRFLRSYAGHRSGCMAHRVRRGGDAGGAAGGLQVGYRIALITGSAGALTIAAYSGWHTSYAAMAALVGVGIVTTLLVPEPHPRVASESVAREERVVMWLERRAHWPRPLLNAGEWFMGAVFCPLLDFSCATVRLWRC